jgi:uncharacterized DUF497 family protein
MDYSISEHAKVVIQERNIKLKDIELTLSDPQLIQKDKKDFTLEHRLRIISTNDSRVLRVVINTNRTPLHIVTAFYDRTMKGKL